MSWAWANRKFGLAFLGSVGFCLFFGFSLLSALGFNASNRGAVVGNREALTARYASAGQDLKDAERKLDALGQLRPTSVITEALGREQQDRRWTSSQACTDATAEGSRSFCKAVADLKIELAASEEADHLTTQIRNLKAKRLDMEQAGADRASDPQADLIMHIVPGLSVEHARLGLNIFAALLMEFGAAFGLLLSTGFLPRRNRQKIRAELVPDSKAPIFIKHSVIGDTATESPARGRQPLRIAFNRNGSLIVDGEND